LINQRQNGRRRGRGGQRQNGGGRNPEMGNRIDNRARGNAAQLLEKYKTLARDAQQSGDRVLAEYYLQFADHYFRVLAESRARYEEANPQARRESRYEGDGDEFDADGNEGESDDGDEFEPRQSRTQQQPRQYRDDRPQQDRSPQDRGDRPQQSRPQQDRGERPYRDDRPRQEERPRQDDRPERAPRDDRGPREARPPRDDRPERAPLRPRGGNGAARHDDDGDVGLPFDALPPAINPAPMEPVAGVEGELATPAPRRRGRPKKVVEDFGTAE
jgi:Domain of unknown function (DUF4167)